ncbi:MAG: hypothetical protein KC503_20070 [Myxococcales bacterium]|nr:hypothetical protein [Myxococcales bacterium]
MPPHDEIRWLTAAVPLARALLCLAAMLRLWTCVALVALAVLAGAGCAGDTLSPDSQPLRFDEGVEPDGPVPWFRDAGCGPGQSGAASGQPCPCGGPSGASGASGAPCDAGVPADSAPPTPDVCVPPSSWTCDVTLSFAKIGSESTAAVHGDFDGPSPTPWVSRAMTLSNNTWRVDLLLVHGTTLTYKFVVDKGLAGESWFHDQANPNTVSDGLGGLNSQLVVSCADPCSR